MTLGLDDPPEAEWAAPVLGQGLRPHQVVLGHVIPRLAEATVIPSLIFYRVAHREGIGTDAGLAVVSRVPA